MVSTSGKSTDVLEGVIMPPARVLVIVPAYNEFASLPHVIRDLHAGPVPAEIVVIDDGSRDQTAAVACQLGVPVVSLPYNLGIGGAVQTGFRYAVERSYEIAIQFDGDGQHLAGEIPALLQPILNETADVVVGSRFALKQGEYRSSFARRAGSMLLAQLIHVLSGRHYTDVTSGFRAYNARALAVVAADYPQDFPEPESLLTLCRYDLRVCEVPVAMRARVGGTSSLNAWRAGYYMVKVGLALCVERLRTRQQGL